MLDRPPACGATTSLDGQGRRRSTYAEHVEGLDRGVARLVEQQLARPRRPPRAATSSSLLPPRSAGARPERPLLRRAGRVVRVVRGAGVLPWPSAPPCGVGRAALHRLHGGGGGRACFAERCTIWLRASACADICVRAAVWFAVGDTIRHDRRVVGELRGRYATDRAFWSFADLVEGGLLRLGRAAVAWRLLKRERWGSTEAPALAVRRSLDQESTFLAQD